MIHNSGYSALLHNRIERGLTGMGDVFMQIMKTCTE